ncbi:hypothetical protein STA3757_04400 [Stanieria sp. NIES-3757]|nr:hypothetical protein STA3757_04400 [Stanieria sp. NIES-3757]
MKKASFNTSACRYCRYYNSEGRRGGSCQKLGVPVESNWDACSLASSPFASPWENLEDILLLENTFSLNCSSQVSAPEKTHSEHSITEQKALTK